jgi:hypothetical protein
MDIDCGGGPGDGSTCTPGCSRDAYSPDRLANALQHQLAAVAHGIGHPHNEAVIDPRSIEAHLPAVVLAFFYEDGHTDRQCIERHQEAYRSMYPLDEKPVLRLNLREPRPFRLG